MHPRQSYPYGSYGPPSHSGKQPIPSAHSMGDPRQSSPRDFPPRQVSPGVTQQQFGQPQFRQPDPLPYPRGSRSSQPPRGYPPRPTMVNQARPGHPTGRNQESFSPRFSVHSESPLPQYRVPTSLSPSAVSINRNQSPNGLPPRGYSSSSNPYPQRFSSPHQVPDRFTTPPQSRFSIPQNLQRMTSPTQSPHQRFSPTQSPHQRFSPTPLQPKFVQPNISPQQRFSTPSQSPHQIKRMPSPQQMHRTPSQHYTGSSRSPQGFTIPSQSPGQRFNPVSSGPRSSPSLLPRGPTSDIRSRFTPSSNSGFQSQPSQPRFPPSSNSGFQSSNTPPSQPRFPPSSNTEFQSSRTPPTLPGPSLSQLSGYHQARRRSFTESNPPDGIKPLSGEKYHPPYKSVKTEGDAVKSEVITYDDIKREALGSPESKPFSPTKLPYMETGCGSTLFRNVTAFSGPTKDERNPALTAKIDEDFSSCRAPLEVLKDVMTDPDWSDTVEENLKKDLLIKAETLKELMPSCSCQGPGAPELGPYYVHLGHAKTFVDLRKLFEARLETEGEALRMEVVRYTGKEGKTSEDCPIAKWVVRRTGPNEKYLVIVKQRFRHFCDYAWIAISIIQWDGLTPELADRAYNELSFRTAKYGTETDRQCAANKKKTCACQGIDLAFNGASYTFGCSWTMYHNICKFCRSNDVHKFKLTDYSAEGDLAKICEEMTEQVTPIYYNLAPDSCNNMCLFSDVAADCRIGTGDRRPFSGITCVCDFCAHAHRDTNNMVGGATAVVTLLRPEDRHAQQKDDEQFHVLPLYVPDCSPTELEKKVASGGLEVLNKFTRTIAIKATKKANCKRGRMPAERKRMMDGFIPKDYTRDARTYNHPSLRPPGLPQLDGAHGLNSSGSSDEDPDANFSLNSSADISGTGDSSTVDVDLDGIMDNMKIVTHESDCLEAFDDPNIGGVALALTHGSILIECAKAELHATTALRQPNRAHPHRIGLVFYQHKNLHHPLHGMEEFQRKRAIREFRDYVQWLKGNYVPTEAKLKAMVESGFVFPNEVKTVHKPMDVANPDDYFRSETFKDPTATKKVEDSLDYIDIESDHQLETFYTSSLSMGPAVDDEINNTPTLPEVKLTNDDLKEVEYYEELLKKEFGPRS